MGNLVKEQAKNLYRSKGVLSFDGRAEKFIIHGVHEQVP
jgi:hypothetical protein